MRRLRLPGILVGDARLGGISATLTAYEALLMRGMDIEAVVLLEEPVRVKTPKCTLNASFQVRIAAQQSN